MSAVQPACDDCLRRAWLVGRVSGWIEHARHGHRSLPEVLALSDTELVEAVARREQEVITAQLGRFDAAAARTATAAAGLAAVCRHDERYPARLLDARDAPAVLFAGGRVERLAALADPEQRVVGIVGTRRASPDGLELARALGRDLGVAGVPVVSGMALGVDSAAQDGALDGGGLSVAVLGGGAEQPYPPSKARLHARLLERGLVVSELPPGTRPRKWTFPARNRIIAGLADLVVVVEAAERSGSLITADLAMKLGREVAALPGPVLSSRCAGTNALLRDGATLVRGVDDVLDALYGPGNAPALARTGGEHLEPHLAALLAAVADGRDTIAALAAGSREDAEAARLGVLELELRGLLCRRPGGRFGVAL